MPKIIFLTLCLIIALSVLVISAPAWAQIIDPDVQTLLSTARVDTKIPVVITRKNPVDVNRLRAPNTTLLRSTIISSLRAQGELSLAPLVDYLKKNGAERLRELWLINSVAAIVPPSTIQELKTYPGISVVRLDDVIQIPVTTPAVSSPLEWNISAVGANELWNLGFTGNNIVVASMDSGVDVNHNDLSVRWRGGTNSWYDPNGEHPVTPFDKDGHGTGVMSVIIGGDASGTAIGMAPGAQWIAVKIFNDAGLAESSAIHLGFQWLLDPDGDPATDDAPDVVNNSWGFRELVDKCYLEFQNDIQILKTAGIAVVFSAGNEGMNPFTSISPANNPESLAVGAVDSNLNIASFSSRGPSACILDNDFFPEVVAPGVNIKVADLTLGGLIPDAVAYLDGTSFAAPHVAGAMALLKEAFPGLSLPDLESALTDAAVDLGVAGPDDDHGYGLVDVLAAYRTLVPCTDADGDGYFVEAVCGTAQDCHDGDLSVYPGAPEIKHDGIDQDCNGYDLTIEITRAFYSPYDGRLEVFATSILEDQADLQLDGVGPMVWNPTAGQWEVTALISGGDPETITVTGVEGSMTMTILPCLGSNDSDNDGILDGCDNCTLIENTDQRDTNGDGFGNLCDTDLDDNGITSASDIAIFRTVLGTDDADADFDGNGVVSASDIAIFRSFLGKPPGPSGLLP